MAGRYVCMYVCIYVIPTYHFTLPFPVLLFTWFHLLSYLPTYLPTLPTCTPPPPLPQERKDALHTIGETVSSGRVTAGNDLLACLVNFLSEHSKKFKVGR